MTRPEALNFITALAITDHPHDPQVLECAATILVEDFPEAANEAQAAAALLRESERRQLKLSRILEDSAR